MMKHNRLFAECEVLDNFRGLCGPGTRTVICKLVLEDSNTGFVSLFGYL